MKSQTFYVGRQLILDKNESIHGYELLFRSTDSLEFATVDNDMIATSRVLVNVFNNIGLNNIVSTHRAFVNICESIIEDDFFEILPKDKFTFEILEESEIDINFLNNIKKLKDIGFKIALDDFIFKKAYIEKFEPVFEYLDYIKIDVLDADMRVFKTNVNKLKKLGVKLIAEKVETHEMYHICKDLEFDFFQGFYFAKPEIIRDVGIDACNMTIAKLIRMLLNDCEPDAIAEAFKEAPAVTLGLLRFINSASNNMKAEVKSIKHAIMMLGNKKLLNWVMLVLYAGTKSKVLASPLLYLVQTRAKTMELLFEVNAKKLSEYNKDEAFMTGLLSLIDVIFQVPLEKALNEFGLDEEIKKAILTEDNSIGRILKLAKYIEHDDFVGINEMMTELNINNKDISNIKLQASGWADKTIESLTA